MYLPISLSYPRPSHTFSCPWISNAYVDGSPHLTPLLSRNILANQPPLGSYPLFQLPPNPLPRLVSRRIPRRPNLLHLPYLRRLPSPDRFRQRSLDDCRRLP